MTDSLDDDTTGDSWNQAAIFWVGLFGIVATGAMVGVGGDNYWAVGHIDPPFVPWMQPFLHTCRSYSTIFQNELFFAILPVSNSNRSQPLTRIFFPSSAVPVNSHSENPRSPQARCRSSE